MTHHVGFTLLFEQGLQVVNPAVSIPYWSYTVECKRDTISLTLTRSSRLSCGRRSRNGDKSYALFAAIGRRRSIYDPQKSTYDRAALATLKWKGDKLVIFHLVVLALRLFLHSHAFPLFASAALGYDSYGDSVVFSPDWFGDASPDNVLHTVDKGRFAFLPVFKVR